MDIAGLLILTVLVVAFEWRSHRTVKRIRAIKAGTVQINKGI